jgi:hypothetical protein
MQDQDSDEKIRALLMKPVLTLHNSPRLQLICAGIIIMTLLAEPYILRNLHMIMGA